MAQNDKKPASLLVVGATGSVGRHVVTEGAVDYGAVKNLLVALDGRRVTCSA